MGHEHAVINQPLHILLLRCASVRGPSARPPVRPSIDRLFRRRRSRECPSNERSIVRSLFAYSRSRLPRTETPARSPQRGVGFILSSKVRFAMYGAIELICHQSCDNPSLNCEQISSIPLTTSPCDGCGTVSIAPFPSPPPDHDLLLRARAFSPHSALHSVSPPSHGITYQAARCATLLPASLRGR